MPEIAYAIYSKGVRVSDGNGDMVRRAAKFADLALKLCVAETTISFWFRKHPNFGNAIKRGRDAYDVEILRDSLIQKATGYTYERVSIKEEEYLLPAQLPFGATVEVPGTHRTVTKETRHVQGDMSAIEFALVNFGRGDYSKPGATQNLKIEGDVKTENKTQSIDWNAAIQVLGVKRFGEFVGLLKQLPQPARNLS
jgi:hypothetical protein